MANIPTKSLAKLLDIKGAEERAIHLNNGVLGQLFVNLDAPVSKVKGANQWYIEDTDGQPAVYDTWTDKLVPLTKQIINIIPETYTYAPRPQNVDMELDYFVRGSGLINHTFIWSSPSIPKDIFATFATHTNFSFLGRYTVTPWVPKINNLGQMVNGFYVMEDEDWVFMYTNL